MYNCRVVMHKVRIKKIDGGVEANFRSPIIYFNLKNKEIKIY